MAHETTYRILSDVPAGSIVEVGLSDGAAGIFRVEAWDLRNDHVYEEALAPGQTVGMGPLNPPSSVYIEGIYAENLDNERITLVAHHNGKVVRRGNPVPLNGSAGDSIQVIVWVYS